MRFIDRNSNMAFEESKTKTPEECQATCAASETCKMWEHAFPASGAADDSPRECRIYEYPIFEASISTETATSYNTGGRACPKSEY